ncbi:MAG: hypothetical protein K2N06_02120 [Oscillospiraceae bacterium]|nr:hypothetical protein [Oscillospiraceae bacterium]
MNFRKMLSGIPHAMSSIYIDKALEQRYVEEFESEWMRVYNLVEQGKKEGSWDKEKSDKIREEAFMKAFEVSENEEIAALVSDDFGLMFEAKSLKIKDKWLDDMAFEYEYGHFPYGRL